MARLKIELGSKSIRGYRYDIIEIVWNMGSRLDDCEQFWQNIAQACERWIIPDPCLGKQITQQYLRPTQVQYRMVSLPRHECISQVKLGLVSNRYWRHPYSS